MKVRDLGEKGLLERLQRFCPPEVVGDDAAVLSTQPGRLLVVTTDMLVDGVHFSDRTTSPEDVGWRAAAANLSDLAAMGASPVGITVALGLPGDVYVNWVERLYQGMVECLQQYETEIVGGDICRSSTVSLAITAFGQAEPVHIIRRDAAQLGDAIVVTGIHGRSRAGLELLLHPELGQSLGTVERLALLQAHQRPRPRLDALPILWRVAGERALAGMDSSDGLADAILQLCQASGVGARIDRCQITIPAALNSWVSPEQALEWALYGGEDFELVLCLPLESAQVLVQHLGEGAAIVGTITSNPLVQLIDQTGESPDQVLTLSRGFQHF
ncbi:MAG: thiamine-phosphate kinase [Chroococcidiopsidaceae cyanobacterium CP_BM_RX_35]|nr:thiamine-phosphate kinase [Chroococcidiopsidaceae cyanobacterium CP_BM_RX_35]